jgi:hypothetical protein
VVLDQIQEAKVFSVPLFRPSFPQELHLFCCATPCYPLGENSILKRGFAMTEPASAIKRQVDDLIRLQISTLMQSSSLTASDLAEYRARSAQINRLFRELDRSKPLPPVPVHKSKHRIHPGL